MKVLVTGAAGFIGSHVAEALVRRGDAVTGLDSFDPFYPRALKERNLASVRADLELVEGDVRDEELLARLLGKRRPDAVVHLAALAGVRAPWSWEELDGVNAGGTAAVARAAGRAGARHLVFASSSSVYPLEAPRPTREGDDGGKPPSSYGTSKKAAEARLFEISRAEELPVTILRYFSVYGPRQRPDMALPTFLRRLTASRAIALHGGGGSSRDYTYVSDAVEGTLRALDAPRSGIRVLNLGAGRPVPLQQLAALLAERLGVPLRTEAAPAPPGQAEHTWACIEAARGELAWEPAVGIEEGLDRFVRWARET